MKFHLITETGDGIGLLPRLEGEGNDVSIDIRRNEAKDIAKNLINRRNGVLSKDTVLLFDFVKLGKVADNYRRLGYRVVGGASENDQLELDRKKGFDLMKTLKIPVPLTFEFKDVNAGIDFVEKTKKPYVIKPNNNDLFTVAPKTVKETLNALDFFSRNEQIKHGFVLQKFLKGTEVSTECWLDSGKYVEGSANKTIEEKNFMNDNLGKQIGCAASTVFKTKPEKWMKEIGKFFPTYIGPIDLNRIYVDGIGYGLEWTPRFGYNAIYALTDLLENPLSDLLSKSVISLKPGYSFALRISIPPYPLELADKKEQAQIYSLIADSLIGKLPKDDVSVWLLDYKQRDDGKLAVAGIDGVIMEISSYGNTIEDAASKVYAAANKLELRDKQYRTDAHLRAIRDVPRVL